VPAWEIDAPENVTAIAELALARLRAKPFEWDTFERSDSGNAELFAHLFGDDLRYDHRTGRWLVWREHWWEADPGEEVRAMALAAARSRGLALYESPPPDERERKRAISFVVGSENRARQESLLRCSRSMVPIKSDAGERWDDDSELMGVENGVVDLLTGALRAGGRGDRITLHTPIAYSETAEAPRWRAFVSQVFGGDEDLVAYVQRAVGYSLTADTDEQVLFFMYGGGANGKSIFLELVEAVLGPYHHNCDFSTLEQRGAFAGGGIAPELVALDGPRLVTASESSDAARLNESRLKALTGGDKITARVPYGPVYSFRPVAKYWLSSNHRPIVRDQSVGFWRRMRMLPFTVQFGCRSGRCATPCTKHPPAEDRKALVRALRAELPGILRWAVEGCLAWRRDGLEPTPRRVLEITEEYKREMDPVAEFLADCTEAAEGEWVGSTELYVAYDRWCESEHVPKKQRLGPKGFSRNVARDFERKSNGRLRVFVGLRLAPVNGNGIVTSHPNGRGDQAHFEYR
jgi:putative DNA primase/helicase